MIEDYDLIVSSFQSQYGLRLSKEIHDMPWAEFCQLLAGISPDTALGRMVSIRSEDDEDILKHFTPGQRRIRAEWMHNRAKAKTERETMAYVEQLKQAFIEMAGGGEN